MAQRFLRVLTERKKGTEKPLMVTLRDGSVAKPGDLVGEDMLLGGAGAYDLLMEEKPLRVKKAAAK